VEQGGARGRAVRRRAFLLGAGALPLAAGALSGCTSPAAAPGARRDPPEPPPAPPAEVTLAVAGGATSAVSPRPRLEAGVAGGALVGVAVRLEPADAGAAEVPGAADATGWTAAEPLALGATYRAVATAENADGARATAELVFTVASEEQAVRAKLMPLHEEVVGVGMPVVVRLTAPVPAEKRRALVDAIAVERPAEVEGAWRWIADDEVHWRPRSYWPAGTRVRVVVPLTQLDLGPAGADGGAGASRWGAEDRDISFTVGESHVSVADADTHRMSVAVGGVVAREFPVSLGREDADPSFVTRSGVHLVLEKHADYLMDGATVGLDYETPVKWATRIANSGEFVHGAPWSVPQQGRANVSHGCINASDEDAKWFHDLSLRGDVVEVVGTDRPMELTNGLGDWTLTWEQWTAA
jgi:lipoprotein-anchoring transpeptidase ErfK/SrfK